MEPQADVPATLTDRRLQSNMAHAGTLVQRPSAAGARTEDWDVMWQNKFTPWDRFEPNPALVDALNEKSDIIDPSPKGSDATRLKRALIPGCGRGYDVLLFASHGYDAYGLDVSQTAVDACRELDKEQGEDALRYPVRDPKLGRGARHFFTAYFFKDDLTSQTNGGSFDIIYDYTFLCALQAEVRPQWAKQMSKLLAPDGTLICLEGPLTKPPKAGGPLHGLSSELYTQLFKQPGMDVTYAEDGHVTPDERSLNQSSGLRRVAQWSPARTHSVGEGADMVSIWKHAGNA